MRRLWKAAVSALIFLVIVIGVSKVSFNTDYRAYFDPQNERVALKNLLDKRFSQQDPLLLILRFPDTLVISDGFLQQFSHLHASLIALPKITSVRSALDPILLNIDHNEPVSVSASPEDSLDELYSDVQQWEQQQKTIDNQNTLSLTPEQRFQKVLSSPGNLLLGREHKRLILRVELEKLDKPKALLNTQAGIQHLVAQHISNWPVVPEVFFSGPQALNLAYIQVVRHDLLLFLPGLIVIVFLGLLGFLKSAKLSALLIGIGFFSVLSGFALAGYLGLPLAAINIFTPVILLGLVVSSAMHLVLAYCRQLTLGNSAAVSAVESVNEVRRPMLFSHLTTAGGFLLLLTSPSPPITSLGWMVSFGVLIAYLVLRWLLPAWLHRSALSKADAFLICNRIRLHPLWRRTKKLSSAVMLLFAAVTSAALFGVSQLTIDDNPYRYFPEDSEYARGIAELKAGYEGIKSISYQIDTANSWGVNTPGFKGFLTLFSQFLAEQSEIVDISGFQLAYLSQGDYQQNLLQALSPSALGLHYWLTDDGRYAIVQLAVKNLSANQLMALDQNIELWLEKHAAEFVVSKGVSADLLFAHLTQNNAKSMFFSLTVALVSIGLLIGLVLRSWTMCALGMVANCLPVLILFALWGAAGGYISMGATLVLGMMIGIIVDDTLHLLMRYQGTKGLHPVYSVMHNVGPAIVTTSSILFVALSVGLLSDFKPIFDLSLLAMGCLVLALLADLLLLPVLLQRWQPKADWGDHQYD